MKKIKSLFRRNHGFQGQHDLVRNEVTPGCEWVIEGEGVSTIKHDGTACMIKGGVFYKRYDAKNGKTPPEGFIPAQEPDEVTGHWPGWIKVGDGPEDKWHREGLQLVKGFFNEKYISECRTYELCGPKINGNPDGYMHHILIPHGSLDEPRCPRDYDGLKEYLQYKDIEGIVWHHPDGRMVKIKKKDFWGSRRIFCGNGKEPEKG